MKDMRSVRFNEKLKRLSTIVGNGGLALTIAAISRGYVFRLDLSAGIWLLIAAGLIWVSVQMSDLLESEDQG